jgi:hypothetical protein
MYDNDVIVNPSQQRDVAGVTCGGADAVAHGSQGGYDIDARGVVRTPHKE